MCGLAGAFGPNQGKIHDDVRRMVGARSHRGPDDEGFEFFNLRNGFLALGHRRLSIIELSQAGHQPMRHEPSNTWLVFNGEIYNHAELRNSLESCGVEFRGRSDTEVILNSFAQWGEQALERLEGMFALALFDARNQELLLARDPLGIKPLYYSLTNYSFTFASEVRALAAAAEGNRLLDMSAVAGLLAYGAVQRPLTMWKHIRELEPGCRMRVRLSDAQPNIETRRFWSYPEVNNKLTRQDFVDELSLRLRDSIKSQLVADVPLGVFLSSGIDSRLIAALSTRESSKRIRTFTVSIESPKLDEADGAQLAACALNTQHTNIKVTETTCQDYTLEWLQSTDQPSVDGLNSYIISKEVRKQGVTVALSGLGGDELFGGYSTFKDVPRIYRYAQATKYVPRSARRKLAKLLLFLADPAQRQKAQDMAELEADVRSIYFQRRRLFSNEEMHSMGILKSELDLDDAFMPAEADVGRFLDGRDLVSSTQILESRFYMGNMLLRDSDVFSMANGLELRVPLLNLRIAELAFSMPSALLVSRENANKQLLVKAGSKVVGDFGVLGRKRGFSLPHGDWILGPLRDLFSDLLSSLKESGVIRPKAVDQAWGHFLQHPNGPAWSRVWMLGSLGHWLKHR